MAKATPIFAGNAMLADIFTRWLYSRLKMESVFHNNNTYTSDVIVGVYRGWVWWGILLFSAPIWQHPQSVSVSNVINFHENKSKNETTSRITSTELNDHILK